MKELSIEEKELLLKDLCARSFYSVMVTVPIMPFIEGQGPYTEPIELVSVNAVYMTCTVGDRYAQISGIKMFNRKGELVCKPYLRSMSSMTEEERNEYLSIKMQETERVALAEVYRPEAISEIMDWLNKHHFDYRGLIEKGLAIEVTEDNNPYKE